MFTYPIDDELELRLPEISDAQELFEVIRDNREHLLPFMFKPLNYHIDDIHSVGDVEPQIKDTRADYANGNAIRALIVSKGKIAGCVKAFDFNKSRGYCELGYWLASDFAGKGVMQKACKALMGYLFGELKMNRVEARCSTRNVKSQATLERLGFQQEGVLRNRSADESGLHDELVLSLLKDEWYKLESE